jgi:purine-nucleoside phosphorylase
MDLYTKIQEATAYIRGELRAAGVTRKPTWGIILGTGLGALAHEVKRAVRIPYTAIPHFVRSQVSSHVGELVIGELEGKQVVVMEGRCHFYEGYSLEEVTLPVRVMKALGIKQLLVSNASGGINTQFSAGDIMVIEDHINLMGVNPLIGPPDERLGPRFPDMIEPYDHTLIARAEKVALDKKIKLQKGVYAAMTGPCLETRAEYRMLKILGADVIGMSTVPEVIVAVHAGLKTVGFSIVTDECFPDALEPVDIDKIIATANGAEKKLRTVVLGLIKGR